MAQTAVSCDGSCNGSIDFISGRGMTLDDCGDSNLALYKKPPCTIYALTGSEPLVYFMIFSDQILFMKNCALTVNLK